MNCTAKCTLSAQLWIARRSSQRLQAQPPAPAKRSKKSAQKQIKKVRKEIEKKRAYFPFEVLCLSEHVETASSGGALDTADLESLGVTLSDLKEGELAGPFVGTHGVHLVYRPDS